MTTNIYDVTKGILATDSRWSIRHGRWILYVDDSGYEKIDLDGNIVFMFAGNGGVIQEWKDWIKSGRNGPYPSPDGISICIVDAQNNKKLFSERHPIQMDDATFAGSGAEFAHGCWSENKDPIQAIMTAAAFDILTGGDVKYVNCHSLKNNLGAGLSVAVRSSTIQDVTTAIMERGYIVETTNAGVPFKQKLAAANCSDVAELASKLASGEILPESPCTSVHSKWTDEQKLALDVALKNAFDR